MWIAWLYSSTVFGQKTFRPCNHSNSWVVSHSEAKTSKFSVSWDCWVINTCWNPLACLAITHPRADLSLFSLHVPRMGSLTSMFMLHFLASVMCHLFRKRGKSCSVSALTSKIFDMGRCIITAHVGPEHSISLFAKSHLLWESIRVPSSNLLANTFTN